MRVRVRVRARVRAKVRVSALRARLISGARCRERAYLRTADRLTRRDTLLA